jgi:hypothetical protein
VSRRNRGSGVRQQSTYQLIPLWKVSGRYRNLIGWLTKETGVITTERGEYSQPTRFYNGGMFSNKKHADRVKASTASNYTTVDGD